MLVSFIVFFVFAFDFLSRKADVSRRVWALIIVVACMLCLLLAYVSVTAVWTPHPIQHDVFHLQNELGEYEGVFPWAKLTYPFYLDVYHTPPNQLTFDGSTSFVRGQARFNTFFASLKSITVNGTFSYPMIRGNAPLNYGLDFVFSDSETFYYFLIVLFEIFNVVGALLGIIFAKILRSRVKGWIRFTRVLPVLACP
jgi:hypothetical protein